MSEGLFSNIRDSLQNLQAIKSKQSGCAVLFDMDQTEGTYAAAFLLAEKFSKLILITPREGVAQETPLVTRQKIQRTLFEKNIEVRYLSSTIYSKFLKAVQLGLKVVNFFIITFFVLKREIRVKESVTTGLAISRHILLSLKVVLWLILVGLKVLASEYGSPDD
jgi:hypothetical protein